MQQLSFGEFQLQDTAPLADRMRPKTLDEVVGQPSIVSPDALLLKSTKGKPHPYSFILYGPPGSGKTSIARLVAKAWDLDYLQLNAVTDGLADLRKAIEKAQASRRIGRRTLLFIDEIARWNKAQQDALLPLVEDGTIVLVGATTENPGFSLNMALRSRMKIERLQALSEESLKTILQKSLQDPNGLNGVYTIETKAQEYLIHQSSGDARALLTALEYASVLARDTAKITFEHVKRASSKQIGGKTQHYHLASALIKTVRGSDPDAALYWLARLQASGEDPVFVARRLLVLASEDIGMANSGALSVSQSAFEAVRVLGAPECWITLAHLTCYLATCPKNWAAYQGFQSAKEFVLQHGEHPVPGWLKNSSTDPMGLEDTDGYSHPSQSTQPQSYWPEGIQEEFYSKNSPPQKK